VVSEDGLTPRERAAVAAGYPADITFGELREETTRAWAIVDLQTKEHAEALDVAYTLLVSAIPSLYRSFLQSPNDVARMLNAVLYDRVTSWVTDHQRETGRTVDSYPPAGTETREP
jgi:hypothetical protein